MFWIVHNCKPNNSNRRVHTCVCAGISWNDCNKRRHCKSPQPGTENTGLDQDLCAKKWVISCFPRFFFLLNTEGSLVERRTLSVLSLVFPIPLLKYCSFVRFSKIKNSMKSHMIKSHGFMVNQSWWNLGVT